MANRNIKSKAVLIGFDPSGKCVYSDILELSEYYDGLHVWDKGSSIKRLKLRRVTGFLFDEKGQLFQEFESLFNLATGDLESGEVRHADGTVHTVRPKSDK